MDRNAEVRIFLMDTECELRPLSAAALLDARRESRRIFAEYGGDENDRILIEDACKVAAGLHIDGKRVFTNGLDALSEMTAEEIMAAAAEYAFDEKRVVQETKSTEDYRAYNVDKGTGDADSDMQTPNTERVPLGEQRELRATRHDVLYEVQAAKINKTYPDIEKGRENSADIGTFRESSEEQVSVKDPYVYSYLLTGTEVSRRGEMADKPETTAATYSVGKLHYQPKGTGHRAEFEAMSSFFERDSRRYDGTFTNY